MEPYKYGLTTGDLDWWYGYQWWIDITANSSHSGGFGGQFIFIKPDLDLVVAITASEYGTEGPVAALYYEYILKSIITRNNASIGLLGIEIFFVLLLLSIMMRKLHPLNHKDKKW